MLPAITVHAAMLLVRRSGSMLAWRIGLELLAATLLGWCLSTAWERFFTNWSAAVGIAIVGLAFYWTLRVIYRAGTLRVMHAQLRHAPHQGVLIEGALAFPDALTSTYLLALLDSAWLGCAVVELIIALHAGIDFTAAVVISATVVAGLIASAFGTFAYVLGIVDECDAADAWPRLRAVLSHAQGRFLPLAALLGALSTLLTCVDYISSLTAQFSSEWPAVLIFVPLVSAFVASVIDVAMLLFVTAITDRLPTGLAARVSIG